MKRNLFVYMAAMGIAGGLALSAYGDTYTVNAGDTQTLDSVTNTTRFTKSGTQLIVR